MRELNLAGIPTGSHNFANDHTVYTHGQGFVAAYGNVTDQFGNPSFFEYNIPPQGLLKLSADGSRVYFGENSPDYSIVGAPAGKAPVEFDYNGAERAGGQHLHRRGRGADGVAVRPHPVRHEVRREQHPAVRPDQLRLARSCGTATRATGSRRSRPG